MLIGVPKEVKDHESRVGLTPSSVAELINSNTKVLIETTAGVGSGYSDEAYIEAGADIVESAKEIFAQADLIVKVKEPQAQERQMLRKESCLFTYLHLAPDIEQTHDLIKSGATCIAYETVTNAKGELPLLTPMSEIAGRIAAQAGAHYLDKTYGGNGTLIGGVPGVAPAKVLVIGGGVVGSSAAKVASGMGAQVTILDKSADTLRRLDNRFDSHVTCLYANEQNLQEQLKISDIVIGAVLVPGAATPKLVKKTDLINLKQGAVLVDVAVDQGGCFETSRPTTHSNPVFIEQGIVHYCVSNMPGAFARTATQALTSATLPFVKALAHKGVLTALSEDPHLLNGLNVIKGHVTNASVADAQNLPCTPLEQALQLFD